MKIITSRFMQTEAAYQSAEVWMTISGIPHGAMFEVAVTDWYGVPLPSTPWSQVGPFNSGFPYVSMWVPTGGRYVAGLRFNDETVYSTQWNPNGFCIGDITLVIGQSNGSGLWTLHDQTIVPSETTVMFHNGLWGSVSGSGAIKMMNEMENLFGTPQALIAGAVGSTALTKPGHEAHSVVFGSHNGYWLNSNAEPYKSTEQAIHQCENRIARVLMIGHESDTIGVNKKTYFQGLTRLRKRINSLVKDRVPEWHFTTLGNYPVPGADTTNVISAITDFCHRTERAHLNTSLLSYPTDESDIHLESYIQLGMDCANEIHLNEV